MFKKFQIFIKMVQAITVLTVLKMMAKAQTCGHGGTGRIMYERVPNYQLQGFDDEVIRESLMPLKVLEKCQDYCLRDRSTANTNMARVCSSFDFQSGNRISNGNGVEYEETTCYLTQEQAEPEGIGHLMYVPNSVHFSEICILSDRPDRECPRSHYVFERYPRKKLDMSQNDLKEVEAENRTECANKCLEEFSFVCRSASFDTSKKMCLISRFTRRTHPELLKDDVNSEYLENTCLNYERRCDGFFAFIMEKNKKLGGPFEVDSIRNSTLEQCKEKCIHSDTYFCRSIEYNENTQECVISEEDSVSQKDELVSSNENHHFYDLICLENPKFGYEYPENSQTSHLFSNRRLPDTAFQRYRNSRLATEFHSEITGKTLSECLDECLRYTAFQCHSVVYSDRFRTCRLSKNNQKTGMRIIYDADYDYYENLMLNTENSNSKHKEDSHGKNDPYANRRPSFEDDRKIPARYPLDPSHERNRYSPSRYRPHGKGEDQQPFRNRPSMSSSNRNNFNPQPSSSSNYDDRPYNYYNDERRPSNFGFNDLDLDTRYYSADPYEFDHIRNKYNQYSPYNDYYFDKGRNRDHLFYNGDNRPNYDYQELPFRDRFPVFSDERVTNPFFYEYRRSNNEHGHGQGQGYGHSNNREKGRNLMLENGINNNINNYDNNRNFGYLSARNKYYTDDSRILEQSKWASTAQNDFNNYDDYVRPNVIGPSSSYCNSEKQHGFKLMALNKKARKSYVKQKLRVKGMPMCERECNEARDFNCRSFNYRDQRSIAHGEAENDLENCELSDQTYKELGYGNFDFLENSFGMNYYERAPDHGEDLEEECLDVSQTCNEDGMEFILKTNEPFYGRLYARDYYDDCFFDANGGTKNVLKISKPKGLPECGTKRFGDIMTNIVVVQYNDNVQTGKDKRFNLTCLMNGPSEAVIRSGYIGAASSGPAPIEYLQARNSPTSRIKMKIYYNGRETSTIAVGDPLTLRIYSDHAGDDIFASNVIARDPHTGRSVTLIDKGCPVNRRVFPEMAKQRQSDGLEAKFHGFKLPESNFLIFEATVYTCKSACQPAYCPITALNRKFGRRKRRHLASNATNNGTSAYETDPREKISELVAVFRSRRQMQQEASVGNSVFDRHLAVHETNLLSTSSLLTSSRCLTNFEYSGLLFGVVLFVCLLSIFSLLIGLIYRKRTMRKSKLRTSSRAESTSSSRTSSSPSLSSPTSFKSNCYRSNECKSTISTIFGSIQKPFSYDANNLFEDPSEPMYTDPSLFERSSNRADDHFQKHSKCSYP